MTLALIPSGLQRQSLGLHRAEAALQAFIETEDDREILDEARRRLDSAAAYYDRESEDWMAAQRLSRRVERRMAPLLPPKEKGGRGKTRYRGNGFPINRKVRVEWELMASVDGLFEDALAAGKVTRRAVVRYLEEALARRVDPDIRLMDADQAGEDWVLLAGDFNERLSDLAGTVDLIVTDPPYPSAMAHLWTDLAKTAASILRPQGILIALSGKIELPDRMERLGSALRYGWVYAEPLERGGTRILGRHVSQEWKPWLAYSKGDWPSGRIDWHGDLLTASTKAKDFRWQQGAETAQFLIQALCPQKGLVVDPFAGHGTYGIAALAAGRRFIGCEIDADRFRAAGERLRESPQ